MNRVRVATWGLIVGLNLALPLARAVADDQTGTGISQNIETQNEKPTTAHAADEQEGRPTDQDVKSQSETMPVYNPPVLVGCPAGLEGGGVRSGTGDGLSSRLSVLAPGYTGLTVQEQPSLYWYLSELTTYPVELTISDDLDEQAIQPLVETRLNTPAQPGVQHIRLADYNVHLSLGVQYQWFVVLVVDPGHRSKDIASWGTIKRIEPTEALRARLDRARWEDIPRIYAEEGLWYDALTAISDLIDTAPNDSVLCKQLTSLLKR